MESRNLAEVLGPVTRRLSRGDVLARMAYIALDGTPWAMPIGFVWTGQHLVMCTATNSAKVKALSANPNVTLTILS
jgi:nitroimidazol reductase NimA-like FMN-containing flavoprotein (pyridoxamine 5'-phosphate oxidase superfamily)